MRCPRPPPGSTPFGAPDWGRQKGITLICSEFPVFFRFVPICAPCFWECPDFPICSDLLHFVPIFVPISKAEQIAEPLLQIPELLLHNDVSV